MQPRRERPKPCSAQTTQTYSGLTPGNHTFTVQATDSSGHTASATYTWKIGSGTATKPRSTAAPKVSGKAFAGALLSTGGGRWSGSPKPRLSYQWQRCNTKVTHCRNIGRATRSSYRLQGSDIGSRIRVVVTATNAAGSASAKARATARVINFASGTLSGITRGRPSLASRLAPRPA